MGREPADTGQAALKLSPLFSIMSLLQLRGAMSRLIDELNRVARAISQPIGFRAERAASSASRMLLIAGLDIPAVSVSSDYISDANAVLFRPGKMRLTATAMQKSIESLPDIPWGGYLEDAGDKKVETLVKAGCDFLVFPVASPVTAMPQDGKVGRILQLQSTPDDGSLRAINELSVDAVLATDACEAGEPVAWQHLIKIQHLANILTKPLLIPVSVNTDSSELKAIWEAGADGVVVEAGTGEPEGLKKLRKAVSELPPRSARKRGKAEALLPRVSREEAGAVPDEEEEEEE